MIPAPPVPELHVETTFLLKFVVCARKVGSPKPEANDVKATPAMTIHCDVAKATDRKLVIDNMHETRTRRFALYGKNGERLLMINDGIMSARRIAPVLIVEHSRP